MTHAEFLKNMGMEIKIARVRQGLSAAKLAKMTGLSPGCLCEIENGKTDGRVLTFKRLTDALGISLKDIM